MCAAPKKNQFWKLRSTHGRDKIFSTPDILRQAAEAYFSWCDDHPWQKKELIKGGNKAGKTFDVPAPIPYTLKGFAMYCNASESFWRNFKAQDLSEEFLNVIEWVEDVIYTHKFTGAVVGAFNANIISRDLGLIDKKEVADNSDQELVEMYKKLKTANDEPPTTD